MSCKITMLCLILLLCLARIDARKKCNAEVIQRLESIKEKVDLLAGECDKKDEVCNNCNYITFGPYGGQGGNFFTDYEDYFQGGIIRELKICWGSERVYGISVKYGSRVVDHAHSTPSPGIQCTEWFVLNPNEVITSVEVYNNDKIRRVNFFTSEGREFGRGPSKDQRHQYNAGGRPLVFISGRFGGSIDQLIFHVKCKKN